jgi:23S rRNA (uracil1939-C5)-methyltransferase
VHATGCDWTIERLVPGGEGFTRLAGGRVGFARGALPGDQVRPLRVVTRKGTSRAVIWQLARPGPMRVTPACAWADRCGGCDWMALDRPAELAAKASLLREAFRRTGGIEQLGSDPAVRVAGPDLGYRSRMRVHIGPRGEVGLLAPGSHRVLEIPHCPVANEELNLALGSLRRIGRTEPRLLQPFAQAELRSAPGGPRVTSHLIPRRRPSARELHEAAHAIGGVVSVQGLPVPEDHTQRWPLGAGLELWAPPGVFTQVNWAVNLELVRSVLDGALDRGMRSFLDLYAGAGNFSLPLLGAGLRGVSVEASGSAVAAARASAEAARLVGGRFLAAPVEAAIRSILADDQRFDLVLLDPPRLGCRALIEPIEALGAPWIALCSCDPVTLARDVRSLFALGYELDTVQPFDMFPHTHHLETLVWLRRGKPRGY